MTRSIKIDDGVYQKIKKIAKQEKRTVKAILELGAVGYMQKRILEK